MKAVVGDENNTAITVSYPNVLLEFGKEQIDQILTCAETIFTVDDIIKKVDIWKRKHAYDVLEVFGKLFADIDIPVQNIDEEESDEDSHDNLSKDMSEIIPDPSFLELLNQSEWDLESLSFTDEQDTFVE